MNKPNYWVLEESEKLPDFIIGGAMKSATTSLHAILDSHPDINIAKEELGFFDLDNILEHPDFSYFNSVEKKWYSQNITKDPKKAWEWYLSQFSSDKKIIGEDSTTYLASKVAAQRIASQKKEIKLIFILRHPTYRTISNYFHLLKSGRAEYNLEKTLQFNPQSIIRRSLYKEQLEYYFSYIPRRNIKIVLFEDFIRSKKVIIREITNFLELDFDKFKKEDFQIHSNETKYYKNEKLLLIKNKLLRSYGRKRYSENVPYPYSTEDSSWFFNKLIDKIHKKINTKTNKKPKINESTISYLNDFFKTEMIGIDELTEIEIYHKWFKE